MAVKDSEELKSNERYPLGDYSFRIERSSVPGSTNDKIEAICTDKDGKNARKSIQVPSSTKMDGWYVEANETEATVYAVVQVPSGDSGEHGSSDFGQGPWPQPVESTSGTLTAKYSDGNLDCAVEYDGNIALLLRDDGYRIDTLLCSSSPGTGRFGDQLNTPYARWTTINVSTAYEHNGKTVYYNSAGYSGYYLTDISGGANITVSGSELNKAQAAWTILYGNPIDPPEFETKTMLIARFAIELKDAGGVGPGGGIGGGWTDPGDYDEDWEEGDPTHTLYVEVTGALSGRHNDPIEDPSYSYIPSDKDTVKDYGCGGDGGHGGGGGAGASTVVIHKFATNQANSKEIIALARRHGYGSGGGKGGKGGDGCILVYY